MNAWNDCLTSIDDAASGMTSISVAPGELVTLKIDDAPDFELRCPEQYRAMIECAAFVNYRRVDVGEPPVLALMRWGWFPDPPDK
jgi:hypothetical protein